MGHSASSNERHTYGEEGEGREVIASSQDGVWRVADDGHSLLLSPFHAWTVMALATRRWSSYGVDISFGDCGLWAVYTVTAEAKL